MKVRFYVTAKDIRDGEDTSANCPVALSIRRRVRASRVHVGAHPYYANITWTLGQKPETLISRFQLPKHVAEKIFRFDRGKGLAPFSFTLEMPAGTPLS